MRALRSKGFTLENTATVKATKKAEKYPHQNLNLISVKEMLDYSMWWLKTTSNNKDHKINQPYNVNFRENVMKG